MRRTSSCTIVWSKEVPILFIGSRQSHFSGLVASTIAAVALSGCGSSSNDASASFQWSIYDIEDTAQKSPLSCSEVGASQVAVTLTNQASPQNPFTNLFSCSLMQASTSSVPAGDYTVGFDLYGDLTTYVNSITLLASFDGSSTYHLYAGTNDYRSATPPFYVQSILVDWAVYSQGVPTTCAAMGAQYVDLEYTVGGSSTQIASRFDCTVASAGTSFPIPFGAKSVQWQLFLVDPSGQAIVSLPGATVAVPNKADINLGTQSFSM
jgi:hypothetical protein